MNKCFKCKHMGGFHHICDECIDGEMYEKVIITNADKIRCMTDKELARFINLERPNCNELCDDVKSGCLYECPHNHGNDIIYKWLQMEVK